MHVIRKVRLGLEGEQHLLLPDEAVVLGVGPLVAPEGTGLFLWYHTHVMEGGHHRTVRLVLTAEDIPGHLAGMRWLGMVTLNPEAPRQMYQVFLEVP